MASPWPRPECPEDRLISLAELYVKLPLFTMRRMKTRTDLEPALWSAHCRWRTKLLNACTEFSLSPAGKTADEVDAAIRELDPVKRRLSDDDMDVISAATALFKGFAELCRWVDASLRGEANSERHLASGEGTGGARR